MVFQRMVPVKNHTLQIREAIPDDAEKMIEYIEIVSGESKNTGFGPGEFNVTPEQEREIVSRYLQADNMVFLLGFIDDELVAMANFASSQRPRFRHTGELGMSVKKKYWRHGIGQAMLQALIDWAKDTGIIRKMNLRVTTYNTAGIGLYEKMGFKRVGIITRDMMIDGEFVDTILMGLEID
ncbi:MAG: N-acetyltransferase [Methanobacteriota archaeon]|nr:MAG: N-acetyltransferase [Euryarchaeota archaeon]